MPIEAIIEFSENNLLIIDGLFNHLDVGPRSNTTCNIYYKTFIAFQLCDKFVISSEGYGLMGIYLKEKITIPQLTIC